MPRKPNPKPTDPEQSMKFLEAAKELEVDKTGKTFENALKILTPATEKNKKIK